MARALEPGSGGFPTADRASQSPLRPPRDSVASGTARHMNQANAIGGYPAANCGARKKQPAIAISDVTIATPTNGDNRSAAGF